MQSFAHLLLLVLFLAAFLSPVYWLYGEMWNLVIARRVGAVLTAVSWAVLGALGTGIAALMNSFELNVKWSTAVCDLLQAADERLEAGEVDRVRKKFASFENAQTYESGAFLRQLSNSTQRLRDDAGEP